MPSSTPVHRLGPTISSPSWVPAHLPQLRRQDHAHLLEKCHPRPVLLALVSDCHPGPWVNSQPGPKRERKGRGPATERRRGRPRAARGAGRGGRGRAAAACGAPLLARLAPPGKQPGSAPANQRAAPPAPERALRLRPPVARGQRPSRLGPPGSFR